MKKPVFTRKESRELIERFIDHFGRLDEISADLKAIRLELAELRKIFAGWDNGAGQISAWIEDSRRRQP